MSVIRAENVSITSLIETVNQLIRNMSILCNLQISIGGRESVVGIATRYGLDHPGIGSLRRRNLPCPSRPTPRPIQLPALWVPGLSRG